MFGPLLRVSLQAGAIGMTVSLNDLVDYNELSASLAAEGRGRGGKRGRGRGGGGGVLGEFDAAVSRVQRARGVVEQAMGGDALGGEGGGGRRSGGKRRRT